MFDQAIAGPDGSGNWCFRDNRASRRDDGWKGLAAVIKVDAATVDTLVGAGGDGQPILTGIRRGDFSLVLQRAIPAALFAVIVQATFGLAEQ